MLPAFALPTPFRHRPLSTSSTFVSRQTTQTCVAVTRHCAAAPTRPPLNASIPSIVAETDAPPQVVDDPSTSSPAPSPPSPGYALRYWTFRSFRVQYAVSGVDQPQLGLQPPDNDDTPGEDHQRPAVVLIHGFGGNCQHWRHNLSPLASEQLRVFAMDLLGFGMGDKPAPGSLDDQGNPIEYNFDMWTQQLEHFIDTVVQPGSHTPVFLVANSIGAMIILQYAVNHAHRCAGLVAISPSLRMLNVRKRSWLQDLTAPILMRLLNYRPLGAFFFDALARADQLRSVLQKAYAVHEAVDDQLVSIIGEPARTPGALDVFLSFISYDVGPIPEDFLPEVTQPTMIIWGEEDQFEPFELGQALKHYAAVESFVALPKTGHCAHDERPAECNDLISQFITKHRHRADSPASDA